jgi:hypothetical protein
MINLGIGIPFRRMGAGIDAQAQAHYDRVIADGGLIPSGLVGVNNFFTTVKAIYGTSDITTAISVGLDAQVLGYKLGAGAGTTAGQAAQKLYSCSGSSGDVVQTTAASQPLLLVHSGANYWWGSGVANNFSSTPSAAANQITGDIEIIVKMQTNDWTPAVQSTIVSKWKDIGGSNYSYLCRLMADGSLRLLTSPDGSNAVNAQSDAVVPFADGDIGYLKFVRDVNNGSGGNSTYFYTSTDGVTYTQLGSTIVNSGTTSIYAGSTPLQIGANDTNGAENPLRAKIFRATISNSIGGTPVVDFNPSQYNAATSQTQWTSTTGEVWTINQSVGNTLKGTIVDRTKTQFVRGLYSMQTGTGTVFLTGNNVTYSEYVAAQLSENLSQSSPVTLKGVGSAQIDFGTTSAIQFYAQDNAGAVRRFDPSFSFSYLLNIFNIIGDSTTTAYLNNVAGSSSSNAQTTTTINQVSLSGSSNYNNFTGVFNTLILTSQADNSTQRTAIWNIIKIINNL